MKNPVSIGKVLSPFGLKGEVKVLPFTLTLARCEELQNVWTNRGNLEVETGRVHGRIWVLKFAGINSREEAEQLKEEELFIPGEERKTLPPGHYYHDQLIGLEVYSEVGRRLGIIKEILSSGGHDIYIVRKDAGAGEILIPAVKAIVKKIDLPGGRIIIDPPDGLLDLFPDKES